MKWLLYLGRGLVGLVVLAVVILLALGGGRGTSRLGASVDVDRPPEVVFAWITEPDRLREWVGWLVEIRPLTAPPLQSGAREIWVMEDRNNNNQRMEIETEIVEYRPNEAVTARLTAAEGFTGRVAYGLIPLGPDGTRLTYAADYDFHHWLAKLLNPVITRSAQQKLEEDLARLKQQAEAADRAPLDR